jgi:hypothetical protein
VCALVTFRSCRLTFRCQFNLAGLSDSLPSHRERDLAAGQNALYYAAVGKCFGVGFCFVIPSDMPAPEYVVQRGDRSVASIAQKFGVSQFEIFAANPQFKGAAIPFGSRLIIPSRSSANARQQLQITGQRAADEIVVSAPRLPNRGPSGPISGGEQVRAGDRYFSEQAS